MLSLRTFKLKLKGKMMLPIILSLIFMLIMGGYTIYETLSRKYIIDELTNVGNNMNSIANMVDSLDKVGIYLKSMDTKVETNTLKSTTEEIKHLINDIQKMTKEIKEEDEKRIFNRILENLQVFLTSLGYIEKEDLTSNEAISPVILNMEGLLNKIRSEFANILKSNAKRFFQYSPIISGSMKRAIISYLILIPLAIIISMSIGIIYSRKTYGNISNSLYAIEKISLGDISNKIHIETGDEIGELAEKLNVFVEKMQNIIGNIKKGNVEISKVVTVIKDMEKEMTETVDKATSKISSVAVASEEMAQTANNIAQNSLNVVKSAEHSKEVAKEGFEVMNRISNVMDETHKIAKDTSSVMEKLSESSKFIEGVVTLIEDIADQTNLLALNAAIEAARAGDQGRGFAVVADEVRSLAERTIKATKDITESIKNIKKEMGDASSLINRNLESVDKAFGIVTNAKKTLEEILKESENVVTQINHIAVASEEQSATVQEITHSITETQNIITDTSLSFKNSAKQSEKLTSLSGLLEDELKFFKLNGVETENIENKRELTVYSDLI